MTNALRKELSGVEEALRAWDPIGILNGPLDTRGPRDEYDSYAPVVLKLVLEGAPKAVIADHLASTRFNTIGVGPNRASEPEREIAERLCEWRDAGCPSRWNWGAVADGA